MTVALDGGAPLQLTYGGGNRVACDVLRDGRVLFEWAGDLYTVYSDGSGVESYRCDHGPDRRGGRQVSSGDIVFESAGRLARFTSARAVQVPLTLPKGEYAGPVAELSPQSWVVSYRPDSTVPHGLYIWGLDQMLPRKVLASALEAVQPVLVQPRPVPKRHPSALGDREGANLLCLNVYTSKLRIAQGTVARVRVWALPDERVAGDAGRSTGREGRLVLCQPALGDGDPVRAGGPCRQDRRCREGLVLGAPRRTARLRRVPCRSGAGSGKRRPEVLLRSTDPRQADGDIEVRNEAERYRSGSIVTSRMARSGAAAPPIRFEEVAAQAGISFTHSFGAEKLGSLLESTGAGAVWFDYNNDGLLDLYVTAAGRSGRACIRTPCGSRRRLRLRNHLYRNDGKGRFTDVTRAGGRRRRPVQHGRHRRRLR